MRQTTPRPIQDIQAELLTAADALRAVVKKLDLVAHMTELKRNYPKDIDTTRIQDGEICPPLAWGVHVDVSHTSILLEDAIQSLETAGHRTEKDVRADWLNERMKDVADPATQALFGFVLSGME